MWKSFDFHFNERLRARSTGTNFISFSAIIFQRLTEKILLLYHRFKTDTVSGDDDSHWVSECCYLGLFKKNYYYSTFKSTQFVWIGHPRLIVVLESISVTHFSTRPELVKHAQSIKLSFKRNKLPTHSLFTVFMFTNFSILFFFFHFFPFHSIWKLHS